jgi:antitoxin (DNA-binding transcriptional repressor) of toxin-antitoxin stability system
VITYRGEPIAVLSPVTSRGKGVEDILALAAGVFDGLNASEVAEVEAAMHRRTDFFGEQAGWPSQGSLL